MSKSRGYFKQCARIIFLLCALLVGQKSVFAALKSDAVDFVAVPKQQSFFTYSPEGDIHVIDEQGLNQKPLLSLREALKQPRLSLFDVVLHPSFSDKSKAGYGTFYTAYRIPYESTSATVRVGDHQNANLYDVVVSEWVYLNHNQEAAPNSRRELFRIATNDSTFKVEQLAFHALLQPWQEEFGYLHILLSASEQIDSPLFNGSLLRVDPKPFGLKQYTIPMSNPFLQDVSVNKEIVLHGLGQPTAIAWQRNSHHDFLIHHRIGTKSMISSLSLGESIRGVNDDYRFVLSKDIELSQIKYFKTHPVNASPLYLMLNDSSSELQTLSFGRQGAKVENADLTFVDEVETPLTELVLIDISDKQLSFYHSQNQAIMSVRYESTSADEASAQNDTKAQLKKKSPMGLFVFLTIIIMIALMVWLNRERIIESHAKRKIRRQYGKVEFIDGLVCLYSRHQEEPTVKISPELIKQSEVLLNQNVVNTLDTLDAPFNDEQEALLKGTFNREYHLKMYGNRVRHVQLILTDINDKKFVVCPYFRIGDQRYTKLHFKPSLVLLVDFQWQLSKAINPTKTPERKAEIIPDEEALKPAKVVSVTRKRPAVKPQAPVQTRHTNGNTQVKVAEQSAPPASVNQTDTKLADVQDTKIIEALEKLVQLHQQGVLDDDEFTKAKRKLIQSLVD